MGRRMVERVHAAQRADRAFERRSTPFLIVHLLGLVPLLVLVGLVFLENGSMPSVAVTLTCAAYVSSTLIQYAVMRSSVLKDMRRDGLATDSYKPPEF